MVKNQQKKVVISFHAPSMHQSSQVVAAMMRVIGYEVSVCSEMTGDQYIKQMEENINKAELVVMLINEHWAYSAQFKQEFLYAQHLCHTGKLLVIPVIFSDVDWKSHPIFSLISKDHNNNIVTVHHDKGNLLTGRVQESLDNICYAALSNNAKNENIEDTSSKNKAEKKLESSSHNNNTGKSHSRRIDSAEEDYLKAVKYENGIEGVYPEINRAISLYEKLSSKGFVLGTFRLAKCNEFGLGVKKSNKKAIEMYMKASADGLAEASYQLIQMKKKVAKKLQKLAEQEDLNATYNLAHCYRYGKGGVEQDLSRAVELFEKCHEQNHLPSINALAEILGQGGNGGVVREDLVKSMVLFEKASSQGYSISTFNLAYNYKIREGYKEDKDIVDMLLAKAEQQDTSLGLLSDLHYETMFKRGYQGFFHSKRREEFFKSKENEQDYLQGLKYEMGEQVQKDQVIAAALYEKSSNNGYLRATYRLGRCYENGVGVEKNKEKAINLYEIASAHGLHDASYRLAKIITKNHVTQYKKDADEGNTNAIHNLAWYWYAGREDIWKAQAMFTRAAKKNHLPSMHMLGVLLLKSGDGFNGKSWLKKSSSKGFSASSWCLLWSYLAACSFFAPDYQNMKVRKWGEKAEMQDRYLGLLSEIDYGLLYYHGYGRLIDTTKAIEFLNLGALAMDDPAYQKYVYTHYHQKSLHRALKVYKTCRTEVGGSSTTTSSASGVATQ